MAFGLFKNPFESLSIENQGKMVSSLEEIRDYFYKGNTIVVALNNLQNLLKLNLKAQDKLTSVLLKRQEKQMTDKDQKEMINNAKVFGPALERIVGAVKDFSDLPEDAVDKFVAGIEKLADSFVKIKDIGQTVSDTAKGLMLMAGAIILFGLAIVIAFPIYLLAIIAAPVVLGVILGFLYLFTKALGDKAGKDILDGAKALMYMAAAVFLFGVALYLSGLVYAELWKGMVGMVAIVLTIGAMIFLMSFLDGFSDTIGDGIRALLLMAAVVGLVGIILYLSGLVYAELWKGFIGMVAILLTIGALVFMMFLIDMLSDTIYDGIRALFLMVAVVGLVGLILFLASKFYEELYDGMIASWPILVVIGALIGLMFLIDQMDSTIYDGVKALVVMILAVALAGIILYVIGKYSEEMKAGLGASWPILILIVALVGVMFLISKIEGDVIKGSAALVIAAFAVIVLAAGLLVFKSANFTVKDSVILSAMLVVLGLVATVLGVVASEAILGAGVLAAIGLAILPLGLGLKYFKESKFNLKDVGILSATIVALGLIATVLGNPFTSWMTAIGVGLMLGIAAAMYPLTKSLLNFKAASWKDSDGENLNKMVASILKAFSMVGDDDLKKEYGIKASWLDVQMGVYALSGIGNIMTELAAGIQAFANLTFTEYEVVKDKDGNSKIQPKSVNKLTQADFENAGKGFAAVVNAILDPIGKVGQAEMDSSSWFGGGKISRGIESLTGLGNIMSSMAKGIQDFANLTFTTYEIYTDKDGRKSIQPKEIRKLSATDFEEAGKGFAAVVNAILDPISKVGEAESNSEGWFSDGYVKKGIESLTGIGNIMSGLAKGIQDFADLKFTTYEIYKDKDGRTSIQPSGIFTLSDPKIDTAVANFKKIIDAIFDPIIGAGKKYLENFTTVNYAIEHVPNMTELMSNIGQAMVDFYNKTGPADSNLMVNSGNFFTLLVNKIVHPFAYAGWYYKKYQADVDATRSLIPDMISKMAIVRQEMANWANADPSKASDSFDYFVTHMMNAFNKPNTPQFMQRLSDFTKNMTMLVLGAPKLEKVADSFERIADAFEDMKESINGMELERLTQVTKLMGFLDGLANGKSDDIVASMGDAITKGMEALKDILEEIKTQLGTPAAAPAGNTGGDGLGVGPGTSDKPKPAGAAPADNKKAAPTIDIQPVVAAINSLKSTLTSDGIKIKNKFPA
jgi:hypothetical protein